MAKFTDLIGRKKKLKGIIHRIKQIELIVAKYCLNDSYPKLM